MRQTINSAGTILLLFSLFIVTEATFAAEQKGGGGNKALIERGRFFVSVGGCNDCHSPKKMTPKGPVPDETRLLSGQPAEEKLPEVPANIISPDKWGGLFNNHLTGWVGPWGTSYASNLTPDRETGLGNVSDELFIKILRTGKFMGGERDILPPMPWQDFGALPDEDLKAIYAYLKVIKPVKNETPASIPAPPLQRQ